MGTAANLTLASAALRASPTLARVSDAALSQLLVPEQPLPPEHVPMSSGLNGEFYRDRTDSGLFWYTPVLALAPDPDASFGFTATQTGAVDTAGNPYFTCKLTFAIAKTASPDLPRLMAQIPAARIREIGIQSLRCLLYVVSKNAQGQDEQSTITGTVAASGATSLALEFDNILGPTVVILYQNLKNGGARVNVIGEFGIWSSFDPTDFPDATHHPAGGGTLPIRRVPFPVSRPPMNGGRPLQLRALSPPLLGRPIVSVSVNPPEAASVSSIAYRRYASSFTQTLALGSKFAANVYSLSYLLVDGTGTRPIVDITDLKNFNNRQSEFVPFTTLGDLTAQFPSISRAYVGVLSKTVVLIPTRYCISRSEDGVNATCAALVDSSSSGASQCKFQLSFLLAPDVSPIDVVELTQQIAKIPALQGYTVTLPSLFKEGTTPTLQTAFTTSVRCTQSDVPHAFSLALDVLDDGQTPAIANVNLLIKQLCSASQPFLLGSLSLKLDDYFPVAVEATIDLNFHNTAGTPSEISTAASADGTATVVTNGSVFDLTIGRYGAVSTSGMVVTNSGALVASGESITLPVPAAATLLLEREPALEGAVAKADIGRFLAFQTQDVQNTEYLMGVNAAGVDFSGLNIKQIDVTVQLTEVGNVNVPGFSLVADRRVNQTNVTVPISAAILSLAATVLLTIQSTTDGQAPATVQISHDFTDDPILLVARHDLGL